MKIQDKLQMQMLRIRYLLSKEGRKDRKQEKQLKKAVIEGFRARRYVRIVSTIELGNFPYGLSDIHAVTATGEILHPDILFPGHDEDSLAVVLASLSGWRVRSRIGSVPNPLGGKPLLQRVVSYAE